MQVRVFTTGGTIDKVYFDAKSDYQVGEPVIADILQDVGVTFEFGVTQLFRKDSLEMTDDDRATIRAAVQAEPAALILITHGTDTMPETARALTGLIGKTIVLTGALTPARFQKTDAVFNIGCAVGALQVLREGVYIAMNGRVFDAANVRKNRDLGRFESL